jgi:hypothetical protein
LSVSSYPKINIVCKTTEFQTILQGMAALGYGLDPHKLTEVLNCLQDNCNNIEEVSYNPDQVCVCVFLCVSVVKAHCPKP